MNQRIKGKVYLAVILAEIFWSLSFIWIKVAFNSYKPITIILFRLIISSVLIFSFGLATKKIKKPTKEGFKNLMLLALFEPFLYFLGESFGLQYVSSTLGAVIIATIPLFTPITAWYFYKEHLHFRNFAGMLISFIGVGIVLLNKDFSIHASTKGLLLLGLAVLSSLGNSVVLKKATTDYNPITVVAFQNGIGAVFFLPLWLLFGMNRFINTPFDLKAMLAIFKLAIVASSLAFVFYAYSFQKLGLIKSSIFVNTIPVFTAIFAHFILGDELSIQKFIGIAFVISGVFLSQINPDWKKFKPIHFSNSNTSNLMDSQEST